MKEAVAGALLVGVAACSPPPSPEPPAPPPALPTPDPAERATWDVAVLAADVTMSSLEARRSGQELHLAFGATRDGRERAIAWRREASGAATSRPVADATGLSAFAIGTDGSWHGIFDSPLAYGVAKTGPVATLEPLPGGQDRTGAGLAVDGRGVPHACYPASDGLVVAVKDPSGWRRQTVDPMGGRCRLAFDAKGTLHLAHVGEQVRYGVRNGEGWAFVTVDSAGASRDPSLALTPDGEPRISWVADDRVLYAHRVSGAWTLEEVGDEVIGWQVALTLDGAGRPHLGFHRRRRVVDESGKPLLDASTAVYAHHDGARWVRHEVGESRSHGIAIGLVLSEPHLFFFDPLRDWLLHARRRAPNDCEPGRVRQGDACCWPGQTAAGASCSGEPRCPEGFFRNTEGGCAALAREIAFGARSCTEIAIDGPIDLGAEKACRLAANHELGPPYFTQRCNAGHAEACYVLGALHDQLLTRQDAYVLMPLCETTCRHAQRSWKGNPIVDDAEDPTKALVAYRRACEMGHADACTRVADLTDDAAERHAQLVALCTKERRRAMCSRAVNEAADIAAIGSVATTLDAMCKGNEPAACGDLGVLTENGEGVKADLDAALKLYAKGCDGHHLPSCRSVAYAGANHPDRRAMLASAAKTAFANLSAECDESGDPRACHGLAVLYDLGFGVARDRARAVALYTKVCTDRTSLLCQRP